MANIAWMKDKKMIKLLVVVLSSTLLVGCLGLTPNMQNYSQLETVRDKAILITELSNADSIKIIKFDQDYNNKQRKIYKLHGITKLYSLHLGSYRQVVFVAEPGIYFISKADYISGNISYYTTLPGLTPEGRVVYGAFEVKPGEVVYLGDLKFNWSQHSANLIDVVSRYSAVTNDLQASSKYRGLVAKLKPAKFYGEGAMISMNENGVAKIESKNQLNM